MGGNKTSLFGLFIGFPCAIVLLGCSGEFKSSIQNKVLSSDLAKEQGNELPGFVAPLATPSQQPQPGGVLPQPTSSPTITNDPIPVPSATPPATPTPNMTPPVSPSATPPPQETAQPTPTPQQPVVEPTPTPTPVPTPTPPVYSSAYLNYRNPSTPSLGYFSKGTPRAVPVISDTELNFLIGTTVNDVLIDGYGGVARNRPAKSGIAQTSDFNGILSLPASPELFFFMKEGPNYAIRNEYANSFNRMSAVVKESSLNSLISYQAKEVGANTPELVSAYRKELEVDFIKMVESHSRSVFLQQYPNGFEIQFALEYPMDCIQGHANGEPGVMICDTQSFRKGFGTGLYQCLSENIQNAPNQKCKDTFLNAKNNLYYKTAEACGDEFRTYCTPFVATHNKFQACLDYLSLRGFAVSPTCESTAREFYATKFGAQPSVAPDRFPETQSLARTNSDSVLPKPEMTISESLDKTFPGSCDNDDQGPTTCRDYPWGSGRYACLSAALPGPAPIGFIGCRLMVYRYQITWRFLEACATKIQQYCTPGEVSTDGSRPCAKKIVATSPAPGSKCQLASYELGVINGQGSPSPSVQELQALTNWLSSVGTTMPEIQGY